MAGVIAAIAVGAIHNRVALGAGVILIASSGFYTAIRLDQQRLDRQRYTRGPGWFLGLGISKLPLGVARLVWLAMSCGILALGIAALISR